MPVPTPKVEESIESYLRFAGSSSPLTERTYRSGLTRFQEYLLSEGVSPTHPLTAISPQLIMDYPPWLNNQRRLEPGGQRGQRRLSERTKSIYLIACMQWFEYVIVQGWLDIPLESYHKVKTLVYSRVKVDPRLRPSRLPSSDFVLAVLLTVRTPRAPLARPGSPARQRNRRLRWLRNRAIVETLVSSGMRVAELVALSRADLLPADQAVEVAGKGKRGRVAFLSPTAWAALQEYLAERDGPRTVQAAPLFARHDAPTPGPPVGLSVRTVELLIRRIAQEAGEQDGHLTPHSFRHHFATVMLRGSGNLALVQDMLGHQDPATTRIYAQVSRDDMRTEHRRLFATDAAAAPPSPEAGAGPTAPRRRFTFEVDDGTLA